MDLGANLSLSAAPGHCSRLLSGPTSPGLRLTCASSLVSTLPLSSLVGGTSLSLERGAAESSPYAANLKSVVEQARSMRPRLARRPPQPADPHVWCRSPDACPSVKITHHFPPHLHLHCHLTPAALSSSPLRIRPWGTRIRGCVSLESSWRPWRRGRRRRRSRWGGHSRRTRWWSMREHLSESTSRWRVGGPALASAAAASTASSSPLQPRSCHGCRCGRW